MTLPWPISQDLYTSPFSSMEITVVKEVKQSCSVFHYRTQPGQITPEKRKIMFHLNSKSEDVTDKAAPFHFPKVSSPLMGTLFTSRTGILCLTPPLLFLLSSTYPLGPSIAPAQLPISFQRLLSSCSSKHAPFSFPSVPHSLCCSSQLL